MHTKPRPFRPSRAHPQPAPARPRFRLCVAGALTDNPFYLSYSSTPVRERWLRVAPRARFVCTVRSDASWVASLVKNRHAGAAWLSERYGLSRPYNRNWNATALRRAKAMHMARECAGVPTLDLGWSDAQLWSAFCAALPPRDDGRPHASGPCAPGGAAATPWPHQNAKGSYNSNFSRGCVFRDT